MGEEIGEEMRPEATRLRLSHMSAPCCQCKRHCKKMECAKAESRMAVIAASCSNVVGLLGIGRLPCQPQLRDYFLLYAERASSTQLSPSS